MQPIMVTVHKFLGPVISIVRVEYNIHSWSQFPWELEGLDYRVVYSKAYVYLEIRPVLRKSIRTVIGSYTYVRSLILPQQQAVNIYQ